MRCLLLLSALLLLGILHARPAAAQIKEMNPARQRAESRRALRDSQKYPAEYKDSHLAVSRTDLRRGEGGLVGKPNDGRAHYKFDKTGTARVSEPKYRALRLRKKNKD
ncbi:MAG TPA: hypothetical protein VF598_12110 [Hymenobacter sp.]